MSRGARTPRSQRPARESVPAPRGPTREGEEDNEEGEQHAKDLEKDAHGASGEPGAEARRREPNRRNRQAPRRRGAISPSSATRPTPARNRAAAVGRGAVEAHSKAHKMAKSPRPEARPRHPARIGSNPVRRCARDRGGRPGIAWTGLPFVPPRTSPFLSPPIPGFKSVEPSSTDLDRSPLRPSKDQPLAPLPVRVVRQSSGAEEGSARRLTPHALGHARTGPFAIRPLRAGLCRSGHNIRGLAPAGSVEDRRDRADQLLRPPAGRRAVCFGEAQRGRLVSAAPWTPGLARRVMKDTALEKLWNRLQPVPYPQHAAPRSPGLTCRSTLGPP